MFVWGIMRKNLCIPHYFRAQSGQCQLPFGILFIFMQLTWNHCTMHPRLSHWIICPKEGLRQMHHVWPSEKKIFTQINEAQFNEKVKVKWEKITCQSWIVLIWAKQMVLLRFRCFRYTCLATSTDFSWQLFFRQHVDVDHFQCLA